MLAVHAGYFPALVATVRTPAKVKAVYISPGGAGNWSGDDWANAAPLHTLNSMIAKAAAIGGEVRLRADAGPYTLPLQLALTKGGSAGAPVVVRGVDVNGLAKPAVLIGNRAPNWTAGQAVGGEHLWFNAGASHLKLASLTFQDAGTCIRLRQANSNLTFEDITGNNIRRLIQNSASSGQTASIDGATFRRCNGYGYSKQFIIMRYDSRNLLFEDCHADAQRQDGDLWSSGFVLDDTAHDVTFRRCTSENNYQDNGDNYWNADGFACERGNYGVLAEDCVARSNTDGGYDFKGQVTLVRCIGDGNKRNFRMWGEADLIDCIGRNPWKIGSGSIGQVFAYAHSRVRVQGGTWTQSTSATSAPFHIFETGFIAVDAAAQAGVTKGGGVPMFDPEGNPDALYQTWDHADATAPTITQLTYRVPGEANPRVIPVTAAGASIAVNENQPQAFLVTASENVTLQVTGPDAGKFGISGRTLQMRAQDYDVANGPAADGSKILKITLRVIDANGNVSAAYPLQIEILDVDDAPIAPAEAFAYPGADGCWFGFSSAQFWADVAMTIPANVGDQVAAISDQSGFGHHMWQPDPERQATLRNDGLYNYLDLNGVSHVYNLGQPGDFRFANFTAIMAIQKGKDAGDGSGYGLFFGRRGLSTDGGANTSNGTFWFGVRGGVSVTYRCTAPNGTSNGTGATPGKSVVLSFRTLDRVVRSNAVQIIPGDGSTGAPITNTYPLANEQALVGARWDGTRYTNFLKGRLYGFAVLNQDCTDPIRFRIERQFGQAGGVSL
ncbi:right-handed parallel beta-helix repeat-containing protein [uncultured Novosphingobium sp.]|uniref:right-handed parallel beta-helix repeat-containing protein n=1 Tax=uncultured Novosphingobium sp. TaxID=292277 RepID=UPI00374A970E